MDKYGINYKAGLSKLTNFIENYVDISTEIDSRKKLNTVIQLEKLFLNPLTFTNYSKNLASWQT